MEENPTNNSEKPTMVFSAKKINNKFIYWCIALIIFVVIVVSVILVVINRKNNSVFTINGISYSQQELKPVVTFPLSFLKQSVNTAYQGILNIKKDQIIANKIGIYPSPSQITTQKNILDSQYSAYTPYSVYQNWASFEAIELAIQNELNTTYSNGLFQGYSYIFWFGNTVDAGPAYTPPNEGNSTIYNQDKSYAFSRANYFYNQLKSNKITGAEALSAVLSDKSLSLNGGTNPSVQFGLNPQVLWGSQVYYQKVIDYISSQTKPGLSAVGSGSIYAGFPKQTTNLAYYYVVDITKVGPSRAEFNAQLKTLNVVYNGISK